ncbi:hypothetical protein ACJJTC_003332 [Scirpophaga incertulas]
MSSDCARCGENKYSGSDCKKVVLYGLNEYYKEPDSNLHDRVQGVFWDLLGVDITGYVDDIYRIGRYNNNGNRPLVIEFICKRMVKHIVENSYCFNQTCLSVSEFLDKTTQLKRKSMRERMFLARKKGLHAVLRQNQLYIEGKRIDFNENIHINDTLSENDTKQKNNLNRSRLNHDSFRK